MSKIMLLKLVSLMLLLALTGCGGGAGAGAATNGTLMFNSLTPTDRTGGLYNLNASAAYVPVTGTVNGTKMNFSWTVTPAGGATTTGSASTTLGTGGLGNVSFDVNQTNVAIYITVTASVGDLTQIKQVTIPAADEQLRTSPDLIAFAQLDTNGVQASQAVTLSGGYLPYSIVAGYASSDIQAKLTGSTTLSISKLVASGSTSIANSTTITLMDSKGTTATVKVLYFK